MGSLTCRSGAPRWRQLSSVRDCLSIHFLLKMDSTLQISWWNTSTPSYTVAQSSPASCLQLGQSWRKLPLGGRNMRLRTSTWLPRRHRSAWNVSFVFKETVAGVAPNLSVVFSRLIQPDSLPMCWRNGNITAISEGSTSSHACNYRPISITPLLPKIY